jgi:type IV pilus assembly protein PilW
VKTPSALHGRQRGFSLIDVMVGIVIALIAVLVIYQVFDISEGIKRNATGAGDAQQNGMLSTFLATLQLANAGANISVNTDPGDTNNLGVCPTADISSMLRPIPVIIKAGATDIDSDSFFVNYGSSERVVTPVALDTNTAATAFDGNGATGMVVQSPLGFRANDVFILLNPSTSKCAWSVVSSVDPGPSVAGDGPGPADKNGDVTIKYRDPDPATGVTFDSSSSLINMGPAPRRVRFDVDATQGSLPDGTTPIGPLRSTEMFYVDTDAGNKTRPFASTGTPVPIANNVVLMKVQYGIGDAGTGYLQKWVAASGDWAYDSVLAQTDLKILSQIKAIRIALVVASESYDKCAYADKCPDPTTNKFTYTLFSQCDDLPCPDPITGSLDPTPGKGNYRYRVYETVVPLRNAVWNTRKVS